MPVIVLDGVALVPPRRRRDCSCTFCCLFRAHHYWLRAAAVSLLAPAVLLFAHVVDGYFTRNHVPGATPVVGAMLLIAAGAAVLALCMWYQPVRRVVHVTWPRFTGWPPPEVTPRR